VPYLVQKGYIQPLDPARLPQWDSIPAVLRDFPGISSDGVTYAAPLDTVDVGIIYRTDRMRSAPKSFRDVFAPQYGGRRAMENDATMGLRLGAAILGWAGDGELSTSRREQVVRYLEAQSPKLTTYYKDSYELEGLFLTDTVDIAAGDRATARKLAAAGVPVAFAVPKEGLLVRARALAIAADARDVDAAYAFIAHSLEASAASAQANARPAAAAGSVLVTAPPSWDTWKQVWQEVLPATGLG
jgi:spermidine/putrescine-binding protein